MKYMIVKILYGEKIHLFFSYAHRGRCGRDSLVVGFTTAYAYHH